MNDNYYISETPIRHIQLDGLRAIAIFTVFMTHWLPAGKVLGFSPGRLGVNLFFVLSGFLITGILLKAKHSITLGEQPFSRAVGHFFARRALRLLPLMYMVLFITTVFNYPTVRETVAWHSLYVGNFFFALHSDWRGPTAHLWSLAVEEQFYMVWPLVILLVPNRLLLKAIIVVIISAPLFRLISFGINIPSLSIRVLTPSSFDMFGIGALLALLSKRNSYEYVANMKLVKWMGIIGFSLLIIATASQHSSSTQVLHVVGQATGSALFFGYLVIRSSVGFSGILGSILSCKPMVYVGTISYGLYVVHNFMPYTLRLLFGEDYWSMYTLEKFVINIIGTFIIASFSWHFFEQPINKLKKHFSYSKT